MATPRPPVWQKNRSLLFCFGHFLKFHTLIRKVYLWLWSYKKIVIIVYKWPTMMPLSKLKITDRLYPYAWQIERTGMIGNTTWHIKFSVLLELEICFVSATYFFNNFNNFPKIDWYRANASAKSHLISFASHSPRCVSQLIRLVKFIFFIPFPTTAKKYFILNR